MRRVISTLIVLVLALVMTTSLMATGGSEMAEGEITLDFPTFWVGQDSKSGPIASLLETFNAMHEGEIRVLIEPNPSTDGYRDKLNTQLASGRAPDLFVFAPDPTTFQYYETDILMDFTDDLAGSWGDVFSGGQIAGATRNGRTKSVPYEVSIIPIWYNSDLFDQAGIDSFPVDLAEFQVAATALKDAGIVPTSQMTGGSNAWTSMLWFSHAAASLGGPGVWDLPLSDPIFTQAAEVLRSMYLDGNTTRDAVGGDAGVSGGHYMAGDTAMFINGPWYIGRIRGDAPEVHAATMLASIPQVGEYSGHQLGGPLSNLGAANTTSAARRDAVVTWMQFMTEPANVRMMSESSGALFGIKYELGADADPLQQEFVRVASEASFLVDHFASAYTVDVVAEFGQALAEMALGEFTPQEFIQALIDKDNE
ncbi:MAG: ABC transporter substrate-binding protein [Spirochaetales bacterium]|nr:ABC transporter substrate-binding protein [Spirochaetales bacterium]